MRFIKQSFLGIELDILVGHPEHDILFIATQVARAAGLKDASYASSTFAKQAAQGHTIQAGALGGSWEIPKSLKFRLQKTSWMFSESATYQMLLRGHAPQSEPFRKWVTEEVLPSIRKTGTYDLFTSETPEAQQFAGDFAALHAKIAGLEAKLDEVLKAVSGAVAAPVVSPYEGQPGVALCDPAGFNVRTYRELAGELLPRPALDRSFRR